MIAFGFEDKRAAKPPKVCLVPIPPRIGAPLGMTLRIALIEPPPAPQVQQKYFARLTIDRPDYPSNAQFFISWVNVAVAAGQTTNHTSLQADCTRPSPEPAGATITDAASKVLGTVWDFNSF